MGSANQAHAWIDAPLCVAQAPERELYSRFEPDSELLCAPESEEGFAVQQQGPMWTAAIGGDEARRALQDAERLATDAPGDALLKIRLVERGMPRIADRLAMLRAKVLLSLGRTEEACEAYRFATESIEQNLAAEARIGLVRCLLRAGKRSAEVELDKLAQRYPKLGDRAALQLELGRARERWNNRAGAIAIYRNIDLTAPETGAAAEAREELARLRAEGVQILPFTPLEVVERAERMVRGGPIEAGHSAVADLLAMTSLPQPLKGRAHLLAAKVARMEGSWDTVREQVTLAMAVGVRAEDAQRLLPRYTVETAVDTAQAEALVKKMLAGRSVKRLKPGQLRGLLDVAIQNGLTDVASEALVTMATVKPPMNPQARFDAGVVASGVASDEAVLTLFEGLRDEWGMHAAASYHHARALERLGRDDEARVEYHEVIELDDGATRYYATWALARLAGFEQFAAGSCQRDSSGGCVPDTGMQLPATTTSTGLAAAPGVSAVFGNAAAEPVDGVSPSAADIKREAIVARLMALVEVHGKAYPWFARAADLVELDRYDDAAAEIGEAYLAYREARGSMRLRAGVEAVLTNVPTGRRVAAGPMRRERLLLDDWARTALADIADLLDEPGIALRLRDLRREPCVRAYASEVEKVAAKYGLDPNLMFAVMRAESVYYRHIVSHAGAVGLMQIMPTTGMRIARALGVRDFNALELLDPRKNLEFAAWYLSSLIRRFDGRLPLAVASYNGGPHNVRLWLNAHPRNMPLDAFLERIPFVETRRYVRRVLTFYAEYRAQQSLPMTNLAVTMPRPHPDAVTF